MHLVRLSLAFDRVKKCPNALQFFRSSLQTHQVCTKPAVPVPYIRIFINPSPQAGTRVVFGSDGRTEHPDRPRVLGSLQSLPIPRPEAGRRFRRGSRAGHQGSDRPSTYGSHLAQPLRPPGRSVRKGPCADFAVLLKQNEHVHRIMMIQYVLYA